MINKIVDNFYKLAEQTITLINEGLIREEIQNSGILKNAHIDLQLIKYRHLNLQEIRVDLLVNSRRETKLVVHLLPREMDDQIQIRAEIEREYGAGFRELIERLEGVVVDEIVIWGVMGTKF